MLGNPRAAGILLHPSSLPGRWGIGEIGPEALRWLDELAEMGQGAWQFLPLGPTGYGNSPYQSLSSFAGNPLLLSIDQLIADGLLAGRDVEDFPNFERGRVQFLRLIEAKWPVLRRACGHFLRQAEVSVSVREAYERFCEEQAWWLDDFALFCALKGRHEGRAWMEWGASLALRQPAALQAARREEAAGVEEAKVLQFLFARQWAQVRERAASLGIRLIGDLPIFVAQDSADTWARRDLFQLDSKGYPRVVAGVPPDYFNSDGQLWGNPLYEWEAHRAEGYVWWTQRLRHVLGQVDLVRIDHFRGFAAYWEVPVERETAREGRWVPGPGAEIFETFRSALGENLPILAEDLGEITPDVFELRDRFGLPGMRVLQFAFGADSLADIYVPENYTENSVAYTGTHDNDTTMGYFRSVPGVGSTRTEEDIEAERQTVLGYTGTDGSELNWDFIRLVLGSESRLAICPLQDVLGLGGEARFNLPGTVDERWWSWRFQWEELDGEMKGRLRRLVEENGRLVLEGKSRGR